MEIRYSGAQDVSAVRDVLLQAAAWQRAQATINQWNTSSFTEEWIRQQTMLVAVDNRIVGVQMYTPRVSMCWEGAREPALYMYKLCVDRAYAGRGVAEALIARCADVARELRLKILRFDCPDDYNFVSYYQRQGFEVMGRGERKSYRYAKLQRVLD